MRITSSASSRGGVGISIGSAAKAIVLALLLGPFAASAQLTVDLLQTFEFDTLNATNLDASDHFATTGRWSVTDSSSKLSTSTDCQKTYPGTILDESDSGTRGLAYDSTDGAQAFLTFAHPAQRTQLSWFFYFKVVGAAFFSSFGEYDLNRNSTDLGADPSLTKIVDDTNETRFHTFVPSDYSTGIPGIQEGTWYATSGKHVKNGTVVARLYDENLVQIGDEQTLAVANENLTNVLFGPIAAENPDVEVTLCLDNLALDWTNAVYPLLPEATEDFGDPLSTNFISDAVPNTAVFLRGTAYATDGSGRYVRACDDPEVFIGGVGHLNDGALCIDASGDIAYELGGWALTADGEVAAEECEPEYFVNGIPRDLSSLRVCMSNVD